MRDYKCDLIVKARVDVLNQKFLIKIPLTISNSHPYIIKNGYNTEILDYVYLHAFSPEHVDVYKITSEYEISDIVKGYVDRWDMMDVLKL
jgi:hypothetical protein